jgi:hypothetical protein
MNPTVDTFVRLFRGRGDVYGHDEGRCVKSQLTDEHWVDHLTGVSGIGIYPAVPTRTEVICAWGCTDIDIEDHSQALLLQDTLSQAGVTSWVERSRSKGYHVWIFTTSPVSAESMRNMQLVAHQVADMDPREVNPKQTDVSLTKYGNYVRLPYFGGMHDTPVRRVIIDRDGEPIPLIQFLGEATDTANDPDVIDRIASMYQPPVHQHVVIDTGDPDLDLASSLREVNGLGYVIWRDGPLQGHDRSRTLVRLAHLCRDSGMSPSQCGMVVRDADRRWGKFHERANGDIELDKIVVRVYQ